jgi:serpin B
MKTKPENHLTGGNKMISNPGPKRWRKAATLAVVLALFMVGINLADEKSADMKKVAGDNNDFAFDMYGKLKSEKGNIFFSPFSISTALAMTYGGARGNTEAEMGKTMHYTLKQDKLHAAMGALIDDLNGRTVKEGWGENRKNVRPFELVVANALWGQKGYPFKKKFDKLNNDNYEAGLTNLDFSADPEKARTTINKWVEDETNDKIKDLIPMGSIGGLTRLVLTNAIYFKSQWQEQFKKRNTKNADFHVSKTKKVKAPMMHQVEHFKYLDEKEFLAVELPYKGRQLAMLVFMPKKANGMAKFEKTLTAANFGKWLAKMKSGNVDLYLPKFKTTSSFVVNDQLRALGMKDAFRLGAADFSGMADTKELFISKVIHKAFVDVDEEGTEAAAATAVEAKGNKVRKPIEVKIDKPFVFLIRDNVTGSILFMGRITDPSGEKVKSGPPGGGAAE